MNRWTQKWMLQPVRLCKNGCMLVRLTAAFILKDEKNG